MSGSRRHRANPGILYALEILKSLERRFFVQNRSKLAAGSWFSHQFLVRKHFMKSLPHLGFSLSVQVSGIGTVTPNCAGEGDTTEMRPYAWSRLNYPITWVILMYW